MDKKTCESLLKAILDEKREEDFRRSVMQKERIIERNKTVQKHNQQLVDLANMGVKVRDAQSAMTKSP
jgi:hypothetical protein